MESVKAVSECYTPVSGIVVEINESVKENPSQINKSPYDQGNYIQLNKIKIIIILINLNLGWLIKLKLTDKDELKKLMDENQYQNYLKSEEH